MVPSCQVCSPKMPTSTLRAVGSLPTSTSSLALVLWWWWLLYERIIGCIVVVGRSDSTWRHKLDYIVDRAVRVRAADCRRQADKQASSTHPDKEDPNPTKQRQKQTSCIADKHCRQVALQTSCIIADKHCKQVACIADKHCRMQTASCRQAVKHTSIIARCMCKGQVPGERTL